MSSSDPDAPREVELNPYAAPGAELGEPLVDLGGESAEAERIRREHLSHEASVKSIGSLHALGAIFGVITVVALAVTAVQGAGPPGQQVGVVAALGAYVMITGLNIALAIGLTRLQAWARWTEVVLMALSLGFLLLAMASLLLLMTMNAQLASVWPVLIVYGFVGLIEGYILYLLLAPKGSVVFSPRYKLIIAQTPHIKHRTSVVVKIFLVILLLVFILGVFRFFFATRR